ncbi:MAG: trypsin-like peptidase domain-containing protein [Thermoplasmata archaeon]|nr:trypsin-like peptidase domain-containing protein [Thermoplasmata archaeon]
MTLTLDTLESQLTDSVARLSRSVVRVTRAATPALRGDRSGIPEASGSGVVIDPRGLVVTNDHVVRGAPSVRVALPDGREVAGERLGEDALTDLALLRIGRTDVPAVELGDSDALKVGQFALAVGNSLGLPGGPTASVGVISALGRPLPGSDFVFEGLLQTDAAINPGNSGGPLADIHGRVIGITTAVAPFAQGVGFAVPINTVRRITDQLLVQGRVARPWLGIMGVAHPSPGSEPGIDLASVIAGSPADLAGLRAGDRILAVGGKGSATLRDLLRRLSELPLGGAVDLTYRRAGSVRRTVVRIMEPTAPRAR